MKPLESMLCTFVQNHREDAARAFESLELGEAVGLLKGLPVDVAASLLERANPHIAAQVLEMMDVPHTCQLTSKLPLRTSAAVLHQMRESRYEEILTSLADSTARPLRALARYAEETAGAIMEPRVAALAIDLTVHQAIAAIRKAPREAIPYLYVTQRDGKLIGVLNMRDLLLAAPRDPIEPLVNHQVVSVADTMDRGKVVELMQQRRFLALPVVDYEGRLIGVVKHDEALRAGQEGAFERLQIVVGAGADERALSPVRKVVRSRLPWLYVNLITVFMAASVIGLFEGLIARVAALAVLLPVIAGQGGNTGSQSLAVVMRGLALREVLPGVRKRVVLKELRGGLINGAAVALVTTVAVFAWRQIAGDALSSSVSMSLVIGLSMIVTMSLAAMTGAIVPLVLKALGRDPAQSAAIFLSTVTNIVGFGTFLGFALLFSQWL
jgi:magnesium transporter